MIYLAKIQLLFYFIDKSENKNTCYFTFLTKSKITLIVIFISIHIRTSIPIYTVSFCHNCVMKYWIVMRIYTFS